MMNISGAAVSELESRRAGEFRVAPRKKSGLLIL
jgi:hypothetical protein